MELLERKLSLDNNKITISFSFIRKLNIFLVFVFTMFAIFTPADSLKLKKMSFIILLIINSLNILTKSLNKQYWVIGFHIFVFFPIINLVSILSGGSLSITLASTYFSLMAGLNIIIDKYKIDYEKYFFNILRLLVLIMLSSFFLDVTGILDIYNNSFLMYMHRNGEAMIGKSPTYWSTYIFFFKASPLLIFLLGYSLFKHKYLFATLTTIALAISGTRANLFAMLIMIAIFLFIHQKKIILKLIIVFLTILISLILFEQINDYFSYMFISKDGSRINKIGDIQEIVQVFKEYPLTIFFGTGFGSETKYGIPHIISEVTLLDLWRKIGLFGLSMFLYYILKPIKRIWKSKETRWVVYSFFLYLAIAMTNPLFYSSTAYIAYIFVYYKYYELLNNNF